MGYALKKHRQDYFLCRRYLEGNFPKCNILNICLIEHGFVISG